MKRLTVKSVLLEGHYIPSSMCSIDREGGIDDEDSCNQYCERHRGSDSKECETCSIQKAFDKLGEYEDSGLTPEEVSSNLTEKHGHAHWYINPDGYYPQCSRCQEEPQGREMTKFCPNCGAIMDDKPR